MRSGDVVQVRGRLREAATTGSRSRLTLEDVWILPIDGDRTCRVARLVTWVDSVERSRAARSTLVVRGEWIRMGPPGRWPRSPGRRGIVVGRIDDSRALSAPTDVRRRPLRSVLRAARERASGRLRTRLPADVDPLGRALVLAERDDISGSVRHRFAEAGLAHLLAISGLHVGLIGAGLTGLLSSLVSRRAAGFGTAVLVWLYVLMIGAPPSAVRAAVLLSGWSVARARGRPVRAWDLLGAAGLVALVSDPLVLGRAGFQLSFCGFIGLGGGVAVTEHLLDRLGAMSRPMTVAVSLVGRRTAEWISRRLDLTARVLGAGLGAFLTTAPIVAVHFQQIAPVAVVSGLIGAPIVAGAIGALALTVALPGPLAGLAGAAAASLLRWLGDAAGLLSRVPGGYLAVPPPGPLVWIVLSLAVVGVWRFVRRGRIAPAMLPVAAAIGLALAAPGFSTRWLGRRSLLCTMDVGQGDAAAIRTSAGRWILFDAGPRGRSRDAGHSVVLPLLRRFGGNRIELFVLSHPDLDHLGGFDAVLDAMPVLRILDSGDPLPKASYLHFLARAEEEGVRWLDAAFGDRVTLDDVSITVLGPPETRPGAPIAERASNATSLQVRVTVNGTFVYLNTGDATAADEHALMRAWPADSLRADVLKVGHHGSRTSTDPAWVRTVAPTLAVISAGRGNAYGHPHPSVVDRLHAARIPHVWRTDREGTLCVEVESDRWRVRGDRRWYEATGAPDSLTLRSGSE